MFRGQMSGETQGMIHFHTFHPAVNGYTLIFMKPPDLSGYNGIVALPSEFSVLNNICFLGMDFTPPLIQVTASELPARSGSLPYAMEVSSTSQLSISYLDDQYEHCFGFHKLWISYIEDVTRGAMTSKEGVPVTPNPKYFDEDSPNFGEIDYMTSAFVIKFKPTEGSYLPGDIVYVGKATGIFPINSPDKEVIGRRDSPELITITYNYPCANYRQWAAGTPNEENDSYIYEEFINDISSIYSKYGGVFNGYRQVV